MKFGNLYSQGEFNSYCFVELYSHNFTEAATSHTISGLTGDTHETYIIEVKLVYNSATAGSLYLRPNNDSDTNYFLSYMYGYDTTADAGSMSTTGLFVVYCANADSAYSDMILHAKSGKERIMGNRSVWGISDGDARIYAAPSVWSNTADEITSLVLVSAQANAIGIGSQIRIFGKEPRL